MTPATQLEVDFVKWLAELSADVPIRYGRWFETEDGDANGGDYCVECVDAEMVAREDPSHEMHEYRFVAGWNDAQETDASPYCDGCGCLLQHSPTEYCIEEEIEFLGELSQLSEDEAARFHNWLSGMGNYQRDKHWPMIKPHAERLMNAAKRAAIRELFSVSCESEVSLATMLGFRRIKLNNSRLAALKWWIEEDLE